MFTKLGVKDIQIGFGKMQEQEKMMKQTKKLSKYPVCDECQYHHNLAINQIFKELEKSAIKAKKEMQTIDDVQRRNPRLAAIEHELGDRIWNFWRIESHILKKKFLDEVC